MTEELETFGFCFVESKKLSFPGLRFPRPNFRRGKCWSFRGHCFHHHFRSQLTWASFSLLSASLPITLFVPSSPLELKFSGFTARRVFRSVLEVKPAGSPILLPATSPCRHLRSVRPQTPTKRMLNASEILTRHVVHHFVTRRTRGFA